MVAGEPWTFTLGDRTLTEGVDSMLVMRTDPASVTGELVFAGYGITGPPFSKAAHPECPLGRTGSTSTPEST